MKNRIADEIRLKHIYDAIESIENFIRDNDFDKFLVKNFLDNMIL